MQFQQTSRESQARTPAEDEQHPAVQLHARVGKRGGVEMKWEKSRHTIHANGSELLYVADGTDLKMESRKRAIPHANGIGHWMHTSYFLIWPDGTEREYFSLTRAKEAAENALD
jgi:hypothetical protein